MSVTRCTSGLMVGRCDRSWAATWSMSLLSRSGETLELKWGNGESGGGVFWADVIAECEGRVSLVLRAAVYREGQL